MTEKPRRLGRGLEALLSPGSRARDAAVESDNPVRRIPISAISPNPYQPRKEFRPEDLDDLERSLRASGLLQPITVRPAVGKDAHFELVAGERRLRAATRIGWNDIPALVKELDDRALLTLALVENLQRTDLNVLEEAEGYRRLVAEFGLTQQQVAEVVGKERTTVANTLRLLNLPSPVQEMVRSGRLSAGHGRALLTLPSARTMLDLANEIVARRLSVRDVERRVKLVDGPPPKPGPKRPSGSEETGSTARGPEVRRITDTLRRRFQTDVSISAVAGKRGEIHISFYSPEDLDRLLDLLLGTGRDGLYK